MTDETRFQVFVSSTFEDLKEERDAVMRALESLHAIPAGMELFPAANEDAWAHIQRVIRDSDYYIVIIGGKYGTVHSSGRSYTELEFDYAQQCGIPVMAFLADLQERKRRQLETDQDSIEHLEAFRTKAKKLLCRSWCDINELTKKSNMRALPEERWPPI